MELDTKYEYLGAIEGTHHIGTIPIHINSLIPPAVDIKEQSPYTFVFQMIGGITIIYLAREFAKSRYANAYKQRVDYIQTQGIRLGYNTIWAVLSAETLLKRTGRYFKNILNEYLVTPFQQEVFQSQSLDYWYIHDGKVINKVPLESAKLFGNTIEQDFGIFYSPAESSIHTDGYITRINNIISFSNRNIVKSNARAISVVIQVGEKNINIGTHITYDGQKLCPYIVGNKLFDRAFTTWVLATKGYTLEDESYTVRIIDNNVEQLEFTNTLEDSTYILVTLTALQIMNMPTNKDEEDRNNDEELSNNNDENVNGENVNDEDVNDESDNDKSVNDENVNDENVNDKNVNDESDNDESVNDESFNDENVNDENVNDENVNDENMNDNREISGEEGVNNEREISGEEGINDNEDVTDDKEVNSDVEEVSDDENKNNEDTSWYSWIPF
jgi:hypothetical protein